MRNVNFQMFKLDLEKAKEPEIKLPTSVGSLKNDRIIQKVLKKEKQVLKQDTLLLYSHWYRV